MLLKLKLFIVALVVTLLSGVSAGLLATPMPVHADPANAASEHPATGSSDQQSTTPASTTPSTSGGDCSTLNKCDLVTKYVQPFIKLLAIFVGLAVVISIVVGGIQYASSADDPQKVTAAKTRIRNAIIALVTFIFLYALLNFLIPGGLQ